MDIDKNTWWIIGGIGGAVLLLLVLWLLTSSQPSKSVETNTDTNSQFPAYNNADATESASAEQTVASGETISVNDQTAGMSVVVGAVTLTKPSWVAIRDTKGWVLGAAWLSASATAVSVPLLRATKTGETYQAVIYVDNGDKMFDLHADSLVTASENAPVSATFNAK